MENVLNFKDVYTFGLSVCVFLLVSSLSLVSYFFLTEKYDLLFLVVVVIVGIASAFLIIHLWRKWYDDVQIPINRERVLSLQRLEYQINSEKSVRAEKVDKIEKRLEDVEGAMVAISKKRLYMASKDFKYDKAEGDKHGK